MKSETLIFLVPGAAVLFYRAKVNCQNGEEDVFTGQEIQSVHNKTSQFKVKSVVSQNEFVSKSVYICP